MILQNFIYKIQKFMFGRNGVDGLGIFLFILSIVIRNASYFSRSFILNALSLILILYVIFRIFSKNLIQRRKENNYFMKYFNAIKNFFTSKSSLARERAAVKKTHKIYLCPKCKRHLKVPKGKGKIEISCPCSHKFIKKT